MGIVRLITIALIIYLAIILYKRWAASQQKNVPRQKKINANMVRCEICQLHVPENEALQHNGRYYCSQKHLEQDKS